MRKKIEETLRKNYKTSRKMKKNEAKLAFPLWEQTTPQNVANIHNFYHLT